MSARPVQPARRRLNRHNLVCSLTLLSFVVSSLGLAPLPFGQPRPGCRCGEDLKAAGQCCCNRAMGSTRCSTGGATNATCCSPKRPQPKSCCGTPVTKSCCASGQAPACTDPESDEPRHSLHARVATDHPASDFRRPAIPASCLIWRAFLPAAVRQSSSWHLNCPHRAVPFLRKLLLRKCPWPSLRPCRPHCARPAAGARTFNLSRGVSPWNSHRSSALSVRADLP